MQSPSAQEKSIGSSQNSKNEKETLLTEVAMAYKSSAEKGDLILRLHMELSMARSREIELTAKLNELTRKYETSVPEPSENKK